MNHYKCLETRESSKGIFESSIIEKEIREPDPGYVLIRVKYSSINYKDALSSTGNKGVTREYPHVTGIDAAGIVEKSHGDILREGDKVIVTGFDLGMNTAGGHAEYITVPERWVLSLPNGLTLRESMIYGTAGLTAALALNKVDGTGNHNKENFVITGATGGVGSLGCALFSAAGYSVTGVSRSLDKAEFLSSMGASSVISSEEFLTNSDRVMMKPRWTGGLETLGGTFLEALLKSSNPDSAVATCGNASSGDLKMSVYPFILRGITLIGIDSAGASINSREAAWQRITELNQKISSKLTFEEVQLDKVPELFAKMLKGKTSGRYVVAT